MNKKLWVTAMSLVASACMATGVVLSASAEGEDPDVPEVPEQTEPIEPTSPMYDADKVFSFYTADMSYNEDNEIVLGPGWTKPGSYAFSSDPFSITYRMNGTGCTQYYLFIKNVETGEMIGYDMMLKASGADYNFQSQIYVTKEAGTNIIKYETIKKLTAEQVSSESITVTYNSVEKKTSISVAGTTKTYDCTKKNQSGDTADFAEELPMGELKPDWALLGSEGITVEAINGVKFSAPDPEVEFVARDNPRQDFIATEPEIDVEYADRGIVLGAATEWEQKPSTIGSDYLFDDTLEIVFRYNALQPTAQGTNKLTYFIIQDASAPDKKITVKLSLNCTTDDEETAKHFLYASVFSGEEGSGQFFASNTNTQQDITDYENVVIRLRYEYEAKKMKLYVGDTFKLLVDLTKTAEGTEADTSTLPSEHLRFNTHVQHGGIVIERVNSYNFKLKYADYVLNYTENTDFFTDLSDARVAYRNSGILITNNDRNNLSFVHAYGNSKYSFTSGNMIFTFHNNELNDLVPTNPTTYEKITRFYIQDADNHVMAIMPYLYKVQNTYVLYVHVMVGENTYVCTNYRVGIEMTPSDAVTDEIWIKYDSVNFTLEVGYPDNYATLNLKRAYVGNVEQSTRPDTSLYPQGELSLRRIEVQAGGIYLHRINQYSFVIENAETPDPVDPVITNFGLESIVFEPNLTITPAFDKGDYDDATLTISYRKITKENNEEYVDLTEEDGVYSVEFEEKAHYQFRYVISFDGTELVALRTVQYTNSTFENIPSLFTTASATVTESANGMELRAGDAETDVLGRAYGQFEVSGASSVVLRLADIYTFVPGSTMTKQIWVDFSDGKNAVWVKLLAFMSDMTNGNIWAYATILSYKDGDANAAQTLRDNVLLDFNFDFAGELDPDLWIEIKYEPEKHLISIGAVGSELKSFDLSAVVVPSLSYNINLGVTYGGIYVKEINGVSMVTGEEGYEYSAPVVIESVITKIITVGNELVLPKKIAYDIFDRNPAATIVLKDSQGNEVELKDLGNGTVTTENIAIGNYKLLITATNAKGKQTVKEYNIKVIKEDHEDPVMTFAPNAFSKYEKGDRENKFNVNSGEEITLPMPTLTDDSGEEVTLRITVKNPRDITSILSGNTFKAEMIGTYTVEYIATDISGKETRQLYYFVVKIKGSNTETEKPNKGCNGSVESALTVSISAAMLAIGAVIVATKKKRNTK